MRGLLGTVALLGWVALGCEGESLVGGLPDRAAPSLDLPVDARAPDDALDAGPRQADDVPPATFDAGPQALAPRAWGGRMVDLSASLDGPNAAPYLSTPTRPGKDPEPIQGIAADLDGDSRVELLFATSYDSPAGRSTGVITLGRDGLAYRGLLETEHMRAQLNAMGAIDLDADGHVDLLFNRGNAELSWGLGDGRFADPVSLRDEPGRYLPPHRAMHVTDIDSDGWLDVITGASSCCSTCRGADVFVRDGARHFSRRDSVLPQAASAAAYALLDGTLANERVLLFAGQSCGNTDGSVFYRARALDAEGYPRFEAWDPTSQWSHIRRNDPSWPASARDSLLRWVPMGIALGDANGDGRDDVVLTFDAVAGLWLGTAGPALLDASGQFHASPFLAAGGRRLLPWGVALVDLDQDGRNDLVLAHGDDHVTASDPAERIGPQRPIIAWNAGGGRFVDVSAALGVTREGQYRSLAVDDLDADGDADLIFGALDENPRVFVNRIGRGNHGFSLRLRGTSSNRLGIGARVRVQTRPGGSFRSYSVGTVGSPGTVTDPITFVGLGTSERAARVEVVWPSGVTQAQSDVPAGAMHVWEEPSLFTITPADRHVPRGARATIVVTPRASDGAIRRGALVGVRTGGAPSTLRAEADGSTTITLSRPGLARSTAVTLTIDGVASGVRPRIFWD